MTAPIRVPCWLRLKRWFRFRTVLATPKLRPCCARGVTPTTRCGMRARCQATWSRCKESVELGHLGIQFANKLGYKVAAVGRGPKIESLALKLGADVYIDSKGEERSRRTAKIRRRKSDYCDSAGR